MKIPSHSTVVAYLALFVAVGGSAYAVTQIDSGDIRNRSIQGKDVARDTLGGKQINEAKLVWRARRRCRVVGRLAIPDGVPVDCLSRTVRLQRHRAC